MSVAGKEPRFWSKREKYFCFESAINVAGHLRATTFLGNGADDDSQFRDRRSRRRRDASEAAAQPPLRRLARGFDDLPRTRSWPRAPGPSCCRVRCAISAPAPRLNPSARRRYEVKGSNRYSKMVARYRQDLLAVHAA